MAGQLAIFSKYEPLVRETEGFRNLIMEEIEKSYHYLTLGHISTIRAIYEDYLRLWVEKGVITNDDYETYKEIYPIFEPFYVSFDREKTTYEDLAELSRKILFGE